MDVSNPVVSNNKVSVASMLQNKKVLRQNLYEMKEFFESRAIVEGIGPNADQEFEYDDDARVAVQQYFSQVAKELKSISQSPNDYTPREFQEQLDKILDSEPFCPVAALTDSETGAVVHPPGKMCEVITTESGEKVTVVSVRRQFGTYMDTTFIEEILSQVLDLKTIKEYAQKYRYCAGTRKGLVNRIAKQMTKPATPETSILYNHLTGKKMEMSVQLKRLRELMPSKLPKETPNWNEPLEALINNLEITKSASAGAPVWGKNFEAIGATINVLLPLYLKHSAGGTLEDLERQVPEMFLAELKNKQDRYKVSELPTKTRPYFCFPQWQKLLFSYLCQYFCKGLETVDMSIHDTRNAYGFCNAHGGLETLYKKMMLEVEEGEPKFWCYGDDTLLVFKENGQLFRVDPDFQQMDGSVDVDTIKLTVRWVYEAFKEQFGDHSFWADVCRDWVRAAYKPKFVVDGAKVYQKKQKRLGLATGVVGTTLIDTVKSVLSWDSVLEEAAATGVKLTDIEGITALMKKRGLIIKPGTYMPEPLPDYNKRGLVTDHKFLGQQMEIVDIEGVQYYHTVPMPTLPEENLLELLLTPREQCSQEQSKTDKAVVFRDRLIGLYVTAGFSKPSVAEVILAALNVSLHRNPEVWLMERQHKAVVGQVGFEKVDYPDDFGYPSLSWCHQLYISPDDKPDIVGEWIYPVKNMQALQREVRVQSAALRIVNKPREDLQGLPDADVFQKRILEVFEEEEDAVEVDPNLVPPISTEEPIKRLTELKKTPSYAQAAVPKEVSGGELQPTRRGIQQAFDKAVEAFLAEDRPLSVLDFQVKSGYNPYDFEKQLAEKGIIIYRGWLFKDNVLVEPAPDPRLNRMVASTKAEPVISASAVKREKVAEAVGAANQVSHAVKILGFVPPFVTCPVLERREAEDVVTWWSRCVQGKNAQIKSSGEFWVPHFELEDTSYNEEGVAVNTFVYRMSKRTIPKPGEKSKTLEEMEVLTGHAANKKIFKQFAADYLIKYYSSSQAVLEKPVDLTSKTATEVMSMPAAQVPVVLPKPPHPPMRRVLEAGESWADTPTERELVEISKVAPDVKPVLPTQAPEQAKVYEDKISRLEIKVDELTSLVNKLVAIVQERQKNPLPLVDLQDEVPEEGVMVHYDPVARTEEKVLPPQQLAEQARSVGYLKKKKRNERNPNPPYKYGRLVRDESGEPSRNVSPPRKSPSQPSKTGWPLDLQSAAAFATYEVNRRMSDLGVYNQKTREQRQLLVYANRRVRKAQAAGAQPQQQDLDLLASLSLEPFTRDSTYYQLWVRKLDAANGRKQVKPTSSAERQIDSSKNGSSKEENSASVSHQASPPQDQAVPGSSKAKETGAKGKYLRGRV